MKRGGIRQAKETHTASPYDMCYIISDHLKGDTGLITLSINNRISRLITWISDLAYRAGIRFTDLTDGTSGSEYEEFSDAGNGMGQVSYIPDDVADKAAELMDKFGNTIIRFAYTYVHNMQDAEDILQDVLISYMRKAPVFENDGHAKAWLLTVTANTSKNRIKYNSYRSHDELNETLVAQHKEDLSFIWEAVSSLPEDSREIFHLFYQEDLTTAQIAQVLGVKESTIRSKLKRGRDKLKTVLKEVYDFGE